MQAGSDRQSAEEPGRAAGLGEQGFVIHFAFEKIVAEMVQYACTVGFLENLQMHRLDVFAEDFRGIHRTAVSQTIWGTDA